MAIFVNGQLVAGASQYISGDGSSIEIAQTTGQSTTSVMSQKAVTDAINKSNSDINITLNATNTTLEGKVDKNQIKQTTGQSITDTMSQKAITDAIASSGGGSSGVQSVTAGTSDGTIKVDSKVVTIPGWSTLSSKANDAYDAANSAQQTINGDGDNGLVDRINKMETGKSGIFQALTSKPTDSSADTHLKQNTLYWYADRTNGLMLQYIIKDNIGTSSHIITIKDNAIKTETILL